MIYVRVMAPCLGFDFKLVGRSIKNILIAGYVDDSVMVVVKISAFRRHYISADSFSVAKAMLFKNALDSLGEKTAFKTLPNSLPVLDIFQLIIFHFGKNLYPIGKLSLIPAAQTAPDLFPGYARELVRRRISVLFVFTGKNFHGYFGIPGEKPVGSQSIGAQITRRVGPPRRNIFRSLSGSPALSFLFYPELNIPAVLLVQRVFVLRVLVVYVPVCLLHAVTASAL